MKKYLILFLFFVIAGCVEPQARVVRTTTLGDIVLDEGNKTIKPKMMFDVYDLDEETSLGLVARIMITQTDSNNSLATIINRIDGSKSKISDIAPGMICRLTTKKTLRAEKKIYKNQKKALKREYKLTKIKSKSKVYESMGKIVEDVNEVSTIKAGLIKVENK
ncbi:MAG: hypothetical protein KAS96_08795 [Planctomycetes bacterium]|nr:hypothetical protein [Planctomycetota bacterium]